MKCVTASLIASMFSACVDLFRYRVQSPSSGGGEEEQGATEPDREPGRGGAAEGKRRGVSSICISILFLVIDFGILICHALNINR